MQQTPQVQEHHAIFGHVDDLSQDDKSFGIGYGEEGDADRSPRLLGIYGFEGSDGDGDGGSQIEMSPHFTY